MQDPDPRETDSRENGNRHTEEERTQVGTEATGPQASSEGPNDVAQEPPATEGLGNVDVWEAAAASVTAQADVKQRHLRLRLRTAARVLSIPVALLVAASVIDYPLTITYPAQLEPLEKAFVRAPREGLIGSVLVDEGQQVEAGAVLGTMADADQQTRVVQIGSELERARAELTVLRMGNRREEIARVRARVEGLTRELEVAKTRQQRVQGLVGQGIAPHGELEQAEATVAMLTGALAQANAELDLVQAGSRPADRRKKEAEVHAIEARLAFEQGLLASGSLTSPIAGVVTTSKPRMLQQTRVGPGDVVFQVAQLHAMRAEIFVHERDFDVLRPGLPVNLKVAAHPTVTFTGAISRIAPQVEVRDKENVVRVEARIENERGLLVPQMTGYGEIVAEPKALLSLSVRRVLRWIRVRFLV